MQQSRTPTGTVTFFAGSTPLGSAALNGNGQASTTISTLTAGTYAITAVYNASTLFAGSTSAAITENVNGAMTTTSLVSAPDPSAYGQAVTFAATVAVPQTAGVPSGIVTFHDGSSVLGTGAVSATGFATLSTASLSVGSHTITASYGGSANDNGSTSAPIVQVVNLASSTVALTGAPNPADVGSSVALVATVSPSMSALPQPTGSVVFADQFGSLGSAPLLNGQAVVTTSTLAVGTHRITSSFGAFGNYAASASAALNEVIQARDFSLTLSPATLTIVSGGTGQVSVGLNSLGSFTGPLALSVAHIPTYATLTFTPVGVSLGQGANSSSALSIETASVPKTALLQKQGSERRRNATPVAVLAFTALPLLLFQRRKLGVLLQILVTLGLLSTLGGCTNLYYAIDRVAPGTYVIPITATDVSTNTSHTVSLTLVVSP